MAQGVVSKDRILKIRSVCEKTTLSRRQIYSLIDEGKFPAGVKLSQRRIGWRESDVDRWIAERM